MPDGSETTAGELLAALMGARVEPVDLPELLHERVQLCRLDGSQLRGRREVADALLDRSSGATFRVLEIEHRAVVIAMELRDLGGWFRIRLHGEVESGTLVQIVMEAE